MAKRKQSYRRGNSQHYRTLQTKSMQARIARHFEVEFVLEPDAKLPWRKRETDAGFDLYNLENVKLSPDAITYARTGVHLSCPEGYFFHLQGRSGLTKEGVLCLTGTIDAHYTGEILIPLINFTPYSVIVKQGERIAQAVFHPILHPQFVEVEKFTVNGQDHRGSKGFGSSGR